MYLGWDSHAAGKLDGVIRSIGLTHGSEGYHHIWVEGSDHALVSLEGRSAMTAVDICVHGERPLVNYTSVSVAPDRYKLIRASTVGVSVCNLKPSIWRGRERLIQNGLKLGDVGPATRACADNSHDCGPRRRTPASSRRAIAVLITTS